MAFRDGFESLNEITCVDINECANESLNDCNVDKSLCSNFDGGYECFCLSGYSGDGIVSVCFIIMKIRFGEDQKGFDIGRNNFVQ